MGGQEPSRDEAGGDGYLEEQKGDEAGGDRYLEEQKEVWNERERERSPVRAGKRNQGRAGESAVMLNSTYSH